MRLLGFVLLLSCFACAPLPEVCDDGTSSSPVPLTANPSAGYLAFAHAHNDYEHARPLEDALAAGFHSVEADVFFADGRFEVSHYGFGSKGTLQALYLDPLRQRVIDHAGSVLGDGVAFTLWVDLKDSNPELPAKLAELLDRYEFLTRFDGGATTPGAVTVVLTGDRGMKEAFVRDQNPRRAIRDSNDFTSGDPAADSAWGYYALDWGKYLEWNGSGTLPSVQSARLACIVNRAHALGRKVRFYAAPDREEAWSAALDHGVDFIHTDRLDELATFLEAKE